jgi:putative ABC transport system substrate-binding protein
MERRTVVLALGFGALVVPLNSFAQQPGKIWRIGILSLPARANAFTASLFGAFLAGLRELGYIEGKNVLIEWRFADGNAARLPALASELVKLRVDVIVTYSTTAVSAAFQATKMIPIVSAAFADPVGSGFAVSLARPGGNVTGMTTMGETLFAKRLELLAIVAPNAARVAFLINPDNPFYSRAMPAYRMAAQKGGKELLAVNARQAGDFEEAFSLMSRERAGALMMADDPFLIAHSSRVAELAVQYGLPSLFGVPAVNAGGLIGYGAPNSAGFRRAALYVDKIFKGAKPGDLPIEEPAQFELVVNLKTAKALGITIPEKLLLRADRVIE